MSLPRTVVRMSRIPPVDYVDDNELLRIRGSGHLMDTPIVKLSEAVGLAEAEHSSWVKAILARDKAQDEHLDMRNQRDEARDQRDDIAIKRVNELTAMRVDLDNAKAERDELKQRLGVEEDRYDERSLDLTATMRERDSLREQVKTERSNFAEEGKRLREENDRLSASPDTPAWEPAWLAERAREVYDLRRQLDRMGAINRQIDARIQELEEAIQERDEARDQRDEIAIKRVNELTTMRTDLDNAKAKRDEALAGNTCHYGGTCISLASGEKQRYEDRIKDLETTVRDLCQREDPNTEPIVRRLREELDRDKATIERQSLSLEVVNQELDAEQEMSARLRRVNEALAGIERRLDAEREMASAARTKAAQLQGIIDEKDRDNKALREALEARMMGKCDHEVRLVFHIGGDLHLQPIPEAKTTVSDMPPDGILLCRKDVNCAARFIGPAARDAHEALHSEDTIGFRCRQKDCTRSLASETALYNHEFSVHGFPKGGVPGAADLEAPKDSTPHGEATG